jgi:hypothetical protein
MSLLDRALIVAIFVFILAIIIVNNSPNYVIYTAEDQNSRILRYKCSDIAFRKGDVWCLHRRQQGFEKIPMWWVLKIDSLKPREPWIPNEH